MELHHRYSNYTLLGEAHAGFRQTASCTAEQHKTIGQAAGLFPGLRQHPEIPTELYQQLQPLHRHSATVYRLLFPENPCPEECCSLTLYDRLTIALSVAQLSDISSLSDFYASFLSPLPGPSGTRQNNIRLTELTQYTRQLAATPHGAPSPAINGLQQAGFTATDILVLHHICGFIDWQARIMTGVMALAGLSQAHEFSSPAVGAFVLSSHLSVAKPAAIDFQTISQPQLDILRQVSALQRPELRACLLAQAPDEAEAWLLLRRERQHTAQLTKNGTRDTQTLCRFTTFPLNTSRQAAAQLRQEGWQTPELLRVLISSAAHEWDQRLIQLSE